jgi:hypothetical protein
MREQLAFSAALEAVAFQLLHEGRVEEVALFAEGRLDDVEQRRVRLVDVDVGLKLETQRPTTPRFTPALLV